ncbi:glycoside hydrolase family 6 protein [Streptomyces sp. NPDC002205]|uniref:glycoside hydrolase family 6 protein n=1 Tax=Streptomyces sp. NPDC002205 TaxID=3154411 RepID=UPI00331CC750
MRFEERMPGDGGDAREVPVAVRPDARPLSRAVTPLQKQTPSPTSRRTWASCTPAGSAGRGLWCNVSGAGLGLPPQATPSGYPDSHLDAFLWIKPPGESDGASSDIPNVEGKRIDPMCDPTYTAPNA